MNCSKYTGILPDLDDDCFELMDSRDFEECDQSNFTVPVSQVSKVSVHRRLVSCRYVFLQHLPASHSALMPSFGSTLFRDNSHARFVRVYSHWQNQILDLSSSTHRLILPALLRLFTSSSCAMSDKAVKQSIHRLKSYKKPQHLYALYCAMKAVILFCPRTSKAVNCHIFEKLPEKRTRDIENLQISLVLDYIVSSIELDLLHYPMVRQRSHDVSKLLAVDSPLIAQLILETETQGGDVKTLALLQRAVAAVSACDKKRLFIDRLVSKLYRLYQRMVCVGDRLRLLASVAEPHLRLKLVELILTSRCSSYVRRPPKQFLTADNASSLSCLLHEWLQGSALSKADGTTADWVEEFLAVIVTYVECNLHIHKGLYCHYFYQLLSRLYCVL